MVGLTDGTVRVVLECIGEGYNGEYNENDPEDAELLRFWVDQLNPESGFWEEVDSASYCTELPASLSQEQQEKVLHIIMDRVKDPLLAGQSIKKIGEELSWLNVKDLLTTRD